MAQGIRVPVAKPDNLNSIPRTQMVEGENQLPQIVLMCTRQSSLAIELFPSSPLPFLSKESLGRTEFSLVVDTLKASLSSNASGRLVCLYVLLFVVAVFFLF